MATGIEAEAPADQAEEIPAESASAEKHGSTGRLRLNRVGRWRTRTGKDRRERSLLSITTQFTGASVLITVLNTATGPLQARALGPAGRGDLAAITIPLTLIPTLLSLGLGVYLMRETARRRSLAVLVGSVGSVLVALGVLAACFSPLVASAFAGGRPVVYTWVFIGFLTMPLTMLGWMLSDLAAGAGRWNLMLFRGLIVPASALACFAVLFVTGSLTVASAAAVTLVTGLLGIVPLLPMLRGMGVPKFDRQVLREGVSFGSKAWLGGLGSMVNVRLDQLLMIRLASPRELGLYVVAVTASGFLINPVIAALQAGMIPRSATEDFSWLGRVLRTTIMGVILVGAGMALAVPVMLPLVFGSSFSGSVAMVWILLVGTVPLAGVNVLSTALTLGGRPGFGAVSELVAVGVTIPGLIVLLPVLGGVGAAIVSVVAYSLNFTILLIGIRRNISVSWRELLILRREDIALLRDRLSAMLPGNLGRRPREAVAS